jgi:hypothetical protein
MNLNWFTLKIVLSFVLIAPGVNVWKTMINLELLPNGSVSVPLLVPVPKYTGIFRLISANAPEGRKESTDSFGFTVIQPKKSPRLSKILVHTPDWEEALVKFLKTWDLRAPTITWGQVLLCGKKSLVRFSVFCFRIFLPDKNRKPYKSNNQNNW